jgi:DNA polymerase-3 subunit alpha
MPPASSSATGRSTELVPLYRDPESDMPVTQFNMKWVEPAGLVKFDFLGLKTLTVLAARRASCVGTGVASEIDLPAIPLDDAQDLRHAGARRDGRRVPGGIARACARRCVEHAARTGFEDIIALVALYRPGPMANIPVYIARKHGDEQPDYYPPEARSRS